MQVNSDNAADNLLGITLESGWKVFKKLEKGDNSTGSFFSICYQVEKDGEICFLKAFDFTKFFSISNSRRAVDVISEMTRAYQYERDLSALCQNNNLTKVAFVKESGEHFLNKFTIGIVPYLIFDLADGDVRKRLALSNDLDFAWKLYSLHSIAVGLKQLHKIGVSHQDLKPSNILIYDAESKIGDLGRSVSVTLPGPYDLEVFSGDFSYAPPEILYGYIDSDRTRRRYLSDCYLLGSMVMFYFTGVSMSATLASYLDDRFLWDKWTGTFDDVKHYLLQAYEQILIDFHNYIKSMDSDYMADELTNAIKWLCYPIPDKRGHLLNPNKTKFDLQRYISKFDLLHRKAKLQILSRY